MKQPGNRVRWRCRRGLLELDLLLQRFLQQDYAGLTEAQVSEFAELLELQDHDLWALVTQERLDAGRTSVSVLALMQRVLQQGYSISN